MARKRYVALLRGINVGGRNKVAMSDLRALFAANGFRDVATYIQSGNVIFESEEPRDTLAGSIEEMLTEQLNLPIVVVVRSHAQLRSVVDKAPDGFGAYPETHHSDVAFLKPPLTGKQAAAAVDPRKGVDRVWPGSGVMYFERLSARRTQSRLSRITQTPQYALMTIRNWRTTTKLLELLDDRLG